MTEKRSRKKQPPLRVIQGGKQDEPSAVNDQVLADTFRRAARLNAFFEHLREEGYCLIFTLDSL